MAVSHSTPRMVLKVPECSNFLRITKLTPINDLILADENLLMSVDINRGLASWFFFHYWYYFPSKEVR